MPALATNDVIEIRTNVDCDNQRCMNVVHYRIATVTGVPDYDTEMIALVAALLMPGAWIGGLLACMSDEATLDYVDAQVIKPTRFYYTRHDIDTPGAVGEFPLPPSVTAQIAKQGTRTGKGLTGHMAVPAIPVTWDNAGELTDDGKTALRTNIANRLDDPIETAGAVYMPIITTHTLGLGAWNDLRHAYVLPELRTQKRRVVRRGI